MTHKKTSTRSDSKLAGIVVKEPGTRHTYRIRWCNRESDTLVAVRGKRVYGSLTPDAKRAVMAAMEGK